MIEYNFNDDEKIIYEVLKECQSYDLYSSITPEELIEKCSTRGLADPKKIEAAVIKMIDGDIAEYEMDDNNETSNIWLIDPSEVRRGA